MTDNDIKKSLSLKSHKNTSVKQSKSTSAKKNVTIQVRRKKYLTLKVYKIKIIIKQMSQ